MSALPVRIGSDGVERCGIGGSDAAGALGVHPYSPRIATWLTLTGRGDQVEENAPMEWGTRLEPAIREKYVARHSCSVFVPSEPRYHSDVDWARGTPDGIVLDGNGDWLYGLEVKTAGMQVAHRWGADGSDQVPHEYIVQAYWYMWIYDLPRWDFAVLIGGSDYHEYTLHRDEETLADIIEGVTAFWNDHVLANVQPPPDDSDDWRQWLRKKYPNSSGKFRDATTGELILLEHYRKSIITLNAAEKTKKTYEARVMDAIGKDRGLTAGELGRVTLSRRIGNPKYKEVAQALAKTAGVNGIELSELIDESRGATSLQLRRPNGWTK